MDPLARKYPQMSPYCYSINNPIRYIDSNGEDVLDKNTRIPLTVSQMQSRTLNLAKSILETDRFNSNIVTTHGHFRKELNQGPFGGKIVSFGGMYNVKEHRRSDYPRFMMNTMFTLVDQQEKIGMYTIGAFAGIEKAPNLGSGVLRLNFDGARIVAGKSEMSDYVIKIIGTLTEVNEVLQSINYEVYYDQENERYDLRQIKNDDKEEDKNE